MKLIIAGSRGFYNYNLLKEEVDTFILNLVEYNLMTGDEEITIVSGGAKGADKLGERYAKERGYHCEIYIPKWSLGKQAGMLRNIDMANASDACIVFNLNDSKGSKHMYEYATRKGLETREIKISDNL